MCNTSDYNESDLHNCPQVGSQVWREHYGTALERTPSTGPCSPARHAKGSLSVLKSQKLTNRLKSFDFFLCHWKFVHLPFTACPAGSWSVLYPNYWGFIWLFTKRLCWLSWRAAFVATAAAAAAADDEKQRLSQPGPSLTKRVLFFILTTPFFPLSFLSACLFCLFQDELVLPMCKPVISKHSLGLGRSDAAAL